MRAAAVGALLAVAAWGQSTSLFRIVPNSGGTAVGQFQLVNLARTYSISLQGPSSFGANYTVTVPAETFTVASRTTNNQFTVSQNLNAYLAVGNGSTINDSTGAGYVIVNADPNAKADQDNEYRGINGTLRFYRTTADEATLGWDQIAGNFTVVATTAMNGGNYIRGHQKGVAAELYYQAPAQAYSAQIGYNFQASLSQVAAGVTLGTWAGLLVGQPAPWGSGGTVTTGYGILIQNLDDAGHVLTSANAAAIKIEGLNNYGRILWTGSSIYEPSAGTFELSASSGVQTAAGVGFRVGGSAANAGIVAGSVGIRIGGVDTTILDGSGNVSTSGYLNSSNSVKIAGTTVIDGSRNASVVNLTITGTCTGCPGAVSSVSGSGAGISVSPTTGSVVVSNTGVTSLTAGTGISLSGSTGSVTVTNAGVTSLGGTTGSISLGGRLQMSAGVLDVNTSVINGSGAFVSSGGVNTSGGVSGGSLGISGTTIIDGSANMSTTGYINTSTGFRFSGTAGQTVTINVDQGGGSCTIVFQGGIKTGGTC